MKIKEIKELMEAVRQNAIAEVEVERAGVKLRIRKEGHPAPIASTLPVSTSSLAASHPAPVASSIGGVGLPTSSQPGSTVTPDEEVYRAPNSNAEAFVKLGDLVEPGRVLCIIEAMKLMNEIESEVSGEIAKIYLENGEPVEFGQALFGIRLVQKT
ncbi:MAG: acetyl-CoA carboxylase, biotin carboxyl carrier protein [Acidobacteria bacterium]|nr:MAG: acetyl-CoA carboxylase, biotin carboxyl carrier protein [Acidobacteriota bacterium]